MIHMKLPLFLKKGATIGIVAPSKPLNTISESNIQVGIENLMDMGFNVMFSQNVNLSLEDPQSAYLRAKDLMEMVKREDIDIIMAAIGGYSSIEIIEYLDYSLLAKARKNFIGFSDITILNSAILKMCNLVNYYGPTFAVFCQKNLPLMTKEFFLKALYSKRSVQLYASDQYADDVWYIHNDGVRSWKKNTGWHLLNAKNFCGRIVGGNLETLLALSGTKYLPDFYGCILFLEEARAKNSAAVRRELQRLKIMGIFEQIEAIVFGRFWGWNQDDQDLFFSQLEKTVLAKFDKPIIYNLDFGHSDPIITIPLGGYIKYENGSLIIYKEISEGGKIWI